MLKLLVLVCVVILFSMNTFAAEPLKIVCIGDSITQGRKGKDKVVPTFSYRYPLWKNFVEAGIAVQCVGSQKTGFEGSPDYEDFKGQKFVNDNEGYWGWTTQAVSDKLKTTSTQWKADLATILLGTNDKDKEKSLEPTLKAMEEIVATLRKNNPKMIIVIGQPFQEWKPFPELGQAYADLAKKLSTADSPVLSVKTSEGG
jgi:lysophospholipase L1-like esterase